LLQTLAEFSNVAIRKAIDGSENCHIQWLLGCYCPGLMRIPTHSGRAYRFEAGRGSDLKPAIIPI